MSRLYSEAIYWWTKKDTINQYPDFFKNILQTVRVPATHTPEGFVTKSLDSAPIRTYLLFAGLILHEFAHAFRLAYFPSALPPFKPWVGDSRDNELGHAVVRHIFGGIPQASYCQPPAGTPDSERWRWEAHTPFGIYFLDKWDQWANLGKDHMVKGAVEDFKAPLVHFPLPARQLYDYFTVDLWKKEVSRYGLDAIKFVKIPEKPREQSTLK
jgi:hypothetical protein